MTDLDASAAAALEAARALYAGRDYVRALGRTRAAIEAFPEDAALWNIHGVLLRQLGRPTEALAALDRAADLAPDLPAARVNAANVLLDLGRVAEAAARFAELARHNPHSAAARAGHGRALLALGQANQAAVELRVATQLDPTVAGVWLRLAEATAAAGGAEAALAVLDEALHLQPDNADLAEGAAALMLRFGAADRLQRHLAAAEQRHEHAAWVQAYWGEMLVERDPAEAERRLRRAGELAPNDVGPPIALAALLSGARGKRPELDLAGAQAQARRAVALGGGDAARLRRLREVLGRLWDFEAIAQLGRGAEIGRALVAAGQPQLLLAQLPWAQTPEDRRELLAQHRLAAAPFEELAQQQPIRRRASVRGGAPIRLGLLSADLRMHPVGLFAEPLFEHPDRRFELHIYDLDPLPPDPLKARFAERAHAVRALAGRPPSDIAQAIAGDGIDILLDLGGWTGANRPEVLAWRPAPLQLSWLGYPLATGFAAVDGFICDAANAPENPEDLGVRPLVLPRSWVAFGRAFAERGAPPVQPRASREGVVFGTTSGAYKYTPAALRAWAAIVRETPGSQFLFIRPEAASSIFRSNVARLFAEQGVDESRLRFEAVSGPAYLQRLGEIDICLDTFPLTGGTTTLDALWCGVPVVTLRGKAFHERIGASILAGAGLEALIADSLPDFAAKARDLALDATGLARLRGGLRERLRVGPLGDAPGFAQVFYDAMAREMAHPR
ncbi:tetratricopeptide repeat protein [Phenylobacterium sp.]|uniref:O-linked N-acetylglucosamine transferase, SPINDLY family protein n=1 Tax=Phenylobacterium sp. TaxID=1871053 RepID=UPI002DEF56D4|nr:tetratricopeptide repeat protein [Phenylobacterium sp.]